MHQNPSLSSFPPARGASRSSAVPSATLGVSFAMIWLSISESAAAEGPIRTTIRNVQESCCGCPDDPFGVLGAQASLSSEFDLVPWDDTNNMDDTTDACEAFLGRPFDLLLGFEEDYNVSKMAFSLVPNGLEAVYPEGQLAPDVAISIGEDSIHYQAMGFRILVPSEHSLPTRQYAAELQILHRKAEGEPNSAPSFLAFGIWIDGEETATEDEAIVGSILEEWQRAVDLRDELCNPSTDGLEEEDPAGDAPAVAGDAPAVVGRGDEQNFGNNPIRNLMESSTLALYDFLSSSTSYYAFEQEAACGSDHSILWNFADTPLKLSGQNLAVVTTLLMSYMDPSCEMVPVTPMTVESTLVDPTSASVTKVCIVEFSAEASEEVSEGVSSEVSEGISKESGSWSTGIRMAILMPLAILML